MQTKRRRHRPSCFDDRGYHVPDLSRIKVPVLSAGNWGGAGLHLRGNIDGFLGAGSEHKLLEIHSGNHVVPFYSLEGRLLQKRFLDQWLYDTDTGILREPRVRLAVRYGEDRYVWRYENEWPIARTQFTPYYLDADNASLSLSSQNSDAQAAYEGNQDAADDDARLVFALAPFEETTEFTGPAALKLWVSSTVDDADLFVIVRKLGADGTEVRFPAQSGPSIPAAVGWLRVSHRKLDLNRSTPERPYHTHDELRKIEPGEIVPVEVEIWPTSVVFEPGERLVLEVASRDDPGMTPFLHTHPADRIQKGTGPPCTPAQRTTSHLLLPVIPPR